MLHIFLCTWCIFLHNHVTCSMMTWYSLYSHVTYIPMYMMYLLFIIMLYVIHNNMMFTFLPCTWYLLLTWSYTFMLHACHFFCMLHFLFTTFMIFLLSNPHTFPCCMLLSSCYILAFLMLHVLDCYYNSNYVSWTNWKSSCF